MSDWKLYIVDKLDNKKMRNYYFHKSFKNFLKSNKQDCFRLRIMEAEKGKETSCTKRKCRYKITWMIGIRISIPK